MKDYFFTLCGIMLNGLYLILKLSPVFMILALAYGVYEIIKYLFFGG